jgi:hypothetical protein
MPPIPRRLLGATGFTLLVSGYVWLGSLLRGEAIDFAAVIGGLLGGAIVGYLAWPAFGIAREPAPSMYPSRVRFAGAATFAILYMVLLLSLILLLSLVFGGREIDPVDAIVTLPFPAVLGYRMFPNLRSSWRERNNRRAR